MEESRKKLSFFTARSFLVENILIKNNSVLLTMSV